MLELWRLKVQYSDLNLQTVQGVYGSAQVHCCTFALVHLTFARIRTRSRTEYCKDTE
jgi:hypothetical protein